MEAEILLILLAFIGSVVGQTWVNHSTHEYLFSLPNSIQERSWYEARTFCMNHGGDLASIHNDLERDFIFGETSKHSLDGDMWIGFNDLDTKNNVWSWSDGSLSGYTQWNSNQGYPDLQNLGRYCAFQKTRQDSGLWMNSHCDNAKAFVCKREKGDTASRTDPPTEAVGGFCPQGYMGIPESNKCYRVVITSEDEGYSWHDALEICRAGPGFLPDLASVANSVEQALITSQLQNSSIGIWIGLYKESSADMTFKWVDNSPLSYTNWAKGEPNNNADLCGEVWALGLNTFGEWNDVPCGATRGYVCQTFKSIDDVIDQNPNSPRPCPQSDYTAYWYGCYKKHRATQTWEAAKAVCEGEGAKLVTIIADAENAAMQLATADDNLPVWTGGNDLQGRGEYVWDDGWTFIYANWAPQEPTIQGGCILFHPDGNWTTTDCTSPNQFVCKQTDLPPLTTPSIGPGTCPAGWYEDGGYCYYLEASEPQDWGTARLKCREKHRESTLASIHSFIEMFYLSQIMATVQNPSGNDFWIGYHRSSADGLWTWVDGTTIQYENWTPGEPNGDLESEACTEAYYPAGKWNDHPCSDPQNYICKMPRISDTTTTAPVGTTPPPGQCPAGWEALSSSCFFFKPDLLFEAGEAETYCQNHGGPDADLASIGSLDESEFIHGRMTALSTVPVDPHGYWIGYKKDGLGEDWYWLDGSVTGYERWAPEEPNDSDGTQNNVEVYWSTAEWNDHSPARLQGLVCELQVVKAAGGSDSGGISGGTVAGIVIGVLVGVLVLAAFLFLGLSYMGVISGPIAARTSSPATGFGYNKHDNPDSVVSA